MNKTVKIVLIVALCLFGVGLLVFFGSSIVTGYRLSDIGSANNDAPISEDGSYDIIEKEIADGRQDIEIDVSFANVTVKPSTDGKIHLTYTEGGKVTFNFDSYPEKISLKQKNISGLGFLNAASGSAKVELLLPEEHAGDLDISSASGVIRLDGVSISGDFDFSSASGDITAENCSCQETDISTASGEIELSNLETASIDADAASGYIEISDINGKPSAELSTASGEISISASELGELEADSKTGGVSLSTVRAQSCSVESTSGVCDLDGVDCTRIRVGTISGSIRGTLLGAPEDYTISTRNISGSNSLQNLGGRGQRTLTVTTTSGDIELDFAD